VFNWYRRAQSDAPPAVRRRNLSPVTQFVAKPRLAVPLVARASAGIPLGALLAARARSRRLPQLRPAYALLWAQRDRLTATCPTTTSTRPHRPPAASLSSASSEPFGDAASRIWVVIGFLRSRRSGLGFLQRAAQLVRRRGGALGLPV